MSTIHPEAISILSINIYRANVNTTDEYLNNPIKPDGFEMNVGQNTAYDLEQKNIRIRLSFHFEAKKNESESLGLTGDYGIEFHIHVDDIEQFIIDKEDEKLIDGKLGGTLNGIVYSTARGIIYERTAATFFNGILLPVIDPNLLKEKS